MRTLRRSIDVLVLVFLVAILTGCVATGRQATSAPAADEDVRTALADEIVTVASFNFPESETLAQVYGQALRRAGYPVAFQLNLGARELVDPALERGLVEFVPEYAGTALSFVARGDIEPTSNPELTHRSLRAILAGRSVDVLEAAPAQDRNGIVVTGETAARYGLRTVSDLAPVASDLVFGGPPECRERPLCLPGLTDTYGLRFDSFVPLDAGGPLTHAALAAGDIDVALLFTSDGLIDGRRLVLLEDDRHLQPAENITPMVRTEVVDRHGPGFVAAVDSVSELLTTASLRDLNRQVSGGATPAETAASFLAGWSPP